MIFRWIEPSLDPGLAQSLIPPKTAPLQIAALYEGSTLAAAGYAEINKSQSKIQIENPYFAAPAALETLLLQLEAETANHTFLSTAILFSESDPKAEDIKTALKKLDWSEPERWMINCHFDHSFNPPWINQPYPLQPGYELRQWKELTLSQVDQLRRKEHQSVFPANLSPFLHGIPDPEYSLCLLHGEEIVGWMTTRRTSDDTISFDSFFVERKYRDINNILKLLSQSVKNVLNSPIPYASMEVNLFQTDTSYINFVHKRYVPYINEYTYTLRSWKLMKF